MLFIKEETENTDLVLKCWTVKTNSMQHSNNNGDSSSFKHT